MKYTYEEVTTESGFLIIKRTNEDGLETWIPADPANSDYQAYLNPVEHLTSPLSNEPDKDVL